MRDIATTIADFLRANGIDAVMVVIPAGILFLIISIRSARRWSKLLYYEKWLLFVEFAASIAMVIAGSVLLLTRSS